jgi:hypothetical protein
MTLRPEQQRALDYARRRGTDAPVAAIRERVAATFETLDALIETIAPEVARVQRATSAWSIQEFVDHLVESDRPAIEQLARLLGGHDVGEPIPASLQSPAPLVKDWSELGCTTSIWRLGVKLMAVREIGYHLTALDAVR